MSKSTDYKNKFISEKYDRINLTVPKGVKELIRKHCEENNLSVNGYLYDLIKEDLNLEQKEEPKTSNRDMDIFLF